MPTQLLTRAQTVPSTLTTASTLWFTAVAAGAFEAALAVAGVLATGSASLGSLAAGMGIRLGVFALAIFMAVRLRQGREWTRYALAVTLGIFGTLSLVIEPVQWLLAGNSVGEFVAGADAMTFLFAGSRIVHLVAVLAAVVLMFAPASNAYFRLSRG